MAQQPDIEIYIKNKTLDELCEWLQERFGAQIKQRTKSKAKLKFEHKGNKIPVKVFTKAAGKDFSCVWFDSPDAPWETDIDCARQAYQDLNTEIRCNAGGWHQDQEPDQWWCINEEGEASILWQQ